MIQRILYWVFIVLLAAWLFAGGLFDSTHATAAIAILHKLGKTAEATDRPRRKLVAASPEAYLGPDGLFANGSYQPWLSTGIYLIRATLDARQPRILLFEFEVIAAGRRTTPSHISEAVLLPSTLSATEVDAQLAMLQRDLNAVARAASVHIA